MVSKKLSQLHLPDSNLFIQHQFPFSSYSERRFMVSMSSPILISLPNLYCHLHCPSCITSISSLILTNNNSYAHYQNHQYLSEIKISYSKLHSQMPSSECEVKGDCSLGKSTWPRSHILRSQVQLIIISLAYNSRLHLLINRDQLLCCLLH